jgi:hypothetical protein
MRVRIKRGYGRTDEWRTDGRTDGFQKRFSALFKSYPRFIQKDKTRIWSIKRFSALFKSYPRFIQKDKTRIWSIKRFSALYKTFFSPLSALYQKG